jgi:hypothetical protein
MVELLLTLNIMGINAGFAGWEIVITAGLS